MGDNLDRDFYEMENETVNVSDTVKDTNKRDRYGNNFTSEVIGDAFGANGDTLVKYDKPSKQRKICIEDDACSIVENVRNIQLELAKGAESVGHMLSDISKREVKKARERARLCHVKPLKSLQKVKTLKGKIEFYEQVRVFDYKYAVGDAVMITTIHQNDKSGQPIDLTKEVESIFMQYRDNKYFTALDYIKNFGFGVIKYIVKNVKGMTLIHLTRYIHSAEVKSAMAAGTALPKKDLLPDIDIRELYICNETLTVTADCIIGPIKLVELMHCKVPTDLMPAMNNSTVLDDFIPPLFFCSMGCNIDNTNGKIEYIPSPGATFSNSPLPLKGHSFDSYVSFCHSSELYSLQFYSHPYFDFTVLPVIKKLIQFGGGTRTMLESKLLLNSLVKSNVAVTARKFDKSNIITEPCVLCGTSLSQNHKGKKVYDIVWKYQKPKNTKSKHKKQTAVYMDEFLRRYKDIMQTVEKKENTEKNIKIKTIKGIAGPKCGLSILMAIKIIKLAKKLFGFLFKDPIQIINPLDADESEKKSEEMQKKFMELKQKFFTLLKDATTF